MLNSSNVNEESQRPNNSNYRETLFKWSVLVIVLLVITIIVLIALPITSEYWYYTNTTEATYKGFIQRETKQYPIVEINGTEYIAKKPQAVRDISYIGNTIQIKYPDGVYEDFLIDWYSNLNQNE